MHNEAILYGLGTRPKLFWSGPCRIPVAPILRASCQELVRKIVLSGKPRLPDPARNRCFIPTQLPASGKLQEAAASRFRAPDNHEMIVPRFYCPIFDSGLAARAGQRWAPSTSTFANVMRVRISRYVFHKFDDPVIFSSPLLRL